MKDKHQRNESKLKIALEYGNHIIATLREPFVVLDKNLRIISANQAFYATFEVTEKDTIGRLLPDLGDSQWNIPDLLQLLKEIVPQKKAVKDYEIEHNFEQIGKRIMILNACQLRVPRKIVTIIAAAAAAAAAEEEEEEEEELILLAIEDITERKKAENRQFLMIECLVLLNRSSDVYSVLYDILKKIRQYSCLEAVGIRLEDNGDFPYFETAGFPDDFVVKERSLCAHSKEGATLKDEQGRPVLECMCGNIIRGRTNPQLPFFTKGGSFFTNSTTDLLASTTESDRMALTRNWCNTVGYESVALIPLKSGDTIVGLLQLNDKRRDRFSSDRIAFYEALGVIIGLAISRMRAEKGLENRALELSAVLQKEIKFREILMSMLEENNRIRDEVSRSEAMFRNIFDEAGDGIVMIDPENKAFYMSNKAFSRMLGYSQEELNTLGVTDIHPKKDIPRVLGQFEKQARGEFVLSIDLPVKRKDGTVCYADISATRVTILGKPYVMELFHDTTERREIENLKWMDKLKKDFITNMSHELRTPLNAIIGFSEVLADQEFGPLNEAQQDYLNDVLQSGKFLLSLINDILDLAKVESGKMEPALSEFSLKDMLEGSLIYVKEKTLKHNIELILEIADDVGSIRADARKVRQIVYNLLSNAVKFTPDGGKVGIKARINGAEAEVTIWDSGIGISKENQKKLFIAFVRLEAPLGKQYEGTGLGLSLAKDFVELHRGRIWVESEGIGEGSAFTFTLPVGAV